MAAMTWLGSEALHPFRAGALAALALLAACGEDSSPDAEETPDVEVTGEPLSTYEPCAVEEDLGAFSIELAVDYTSVSGKIEGAVNPVALTVELAREGSCRLVKPPAFNCDPPCASSEWCGADSICATKPPKALDLGTVSVQGLSAPASMIPNPNTNGYSLAPPLPHPGFEPGANILLTTTGGEFDPITLRGWGVSLFELTEQARVDPGMATALRWSTPVDPGPAHVAVNLEINVHGANKAWIECDFPDTGAAEIPATLIDALIAQGLSGDPTIIVARQTASSSQIEPGCVELLVESKVSTAVTVAGLTSCEDSSQCPDGMTCRAVEMFCE
jgi:hypothetical protein